MLRFFAASVLLGIVIWGVLETILQWGWVSQKPSYGLVILGFVLFATVVIYSKLHAEKSGHFFVQLYLASTVLKILVYGAFLTVLILKNQAGAFGNTVFFMITYILFTFLEVAFLYRHIRI